MLAPVLSAAHPSQFEVNLKDLPAREKSRVGEPNWGRPSGSRENDRFQWGYYLEVIPPLVPASPQSLSVLDSIENSDSLAVSEEQQGPSQATRKHVTAAPRAMAFKTHTWISLWFLITAPVILWDAGYCFFRPRSMIGGDLHWLWLPYGKYQNVDWVYGVKALKEHSGFPNAQSLLNIFETILNIAYLYLAHVVAWPPAALIGLSSAVMTLSKTILYWAQEYYCGLCDIGHNSLKDLIIFWIIPNGLWLVVPSFIIWQFSKDLVDSLLVSAKTSKKAASGKTK